uniref:Zinc finger CCCH domain-containing protein 15 n=2 Tax=Lygus hesperus TaxID=30085 RepID=A0A0A9X9Y2_LYGHE
MWEDLGRRAVQLRMKPGLIFLLRLAWESRIRLPLLIMSGFMALGLRIQMEINIDRTSRFIPRLRLDDDEFALTDGEDMDTDDESDETDENDDENDDDTSWLHGSNYDTEDYDSYDEEFYDDTPSSTSTPSAQCPATH